MKFQKWFLAVFIFAASFGLPPRAAPQEKPAPRQATVPAADEKPPAQSPGIVEGTLSKSASEPGYLDAQQVKEWLEQVRFAEFRLNDLLTDLHPERWKMPDAARNSFGQTLATLRAQVEALKIRRAQFAARPDSMYTGYETYATLGAILPRLEGVARSVSQAGNPSFGAQFSQAADRLFDLQQTLGSYLGLLLRNQDAILQALENNLAGCQKDLGQAMRDRTERPKWMKNSPPVRPQRRGSRRGTTSPARSAEQQSGEKKPAATSPPKKNP